MSLALDYARRFDVVQDNPFPPLFRELDAEFPGSKFILTTEDPDVWIDRAVRYFGPNETPMRRWIYGKGSPIGNEAVYLDRFKTHQNNVLELSKIVKTTYTCLAFNPEAEWGKTRTFLGVDLPENTEFPHENKGRTHLHKIATVDISIRIY